MGHSRQKYGAQERFMLIQKFRLHRHLLNNREQIAGIDLSKDDFWQLVREYKKMMDALRDENHKLKMEHDDLKGESSRLKRDHEETMANHKQLERHIEDSTGNFTTQIQQLQELNEELESKSRCRNCRWEMLIIVMWCISIAIAVLAPLILVSLQTSDTGRLEAARDIRLQNQQSRSPG
ncbi:hypothetical protein BDZ45DRAFT_740965 [Acephala macrosclerotiorum]|nr:hypothetical protein BDZ45DRAFT_740965 [Acephala macrosclerotiorum]